jgi:hypothetical protein
LAFMDRGQKGKAVSKSDNFEAVSSQTSKNWVFLLQWQVVISKNSNILLCLLLQLLS